MCGIVGVMNFEPGAVSGHHMNMFMNLLWSDAARGMHGTGAFAVANNGENYRVRVGGPPHQLIDSSEFDKFDKFVSKKWVRAVVGHNRYATRGNITTEHSHPFRSKDGNILLVHNGTLDAFKHLPDAKNFDVDSEAICHAFSVQGAEKTIPTLKGAWALVWYDNKDKTINFLRNKERPLAMARHQKEKFLAWSSEPGLVKWVLNRNGMYLFDVEEIPVDTWISFELNGGKPKIKELKGAEDKKGKDGYWEGWAGRQEAISGKSQVEEDKSATPVVLLPHKKSSSGSSTASTGTDLTARGIPFQKKNTHVATKSDKGYWIAVESLHDVNKKSVLRVWPLDFRAIETDKARKDGVYQVKALSDDYPDIEFLCNVRGETSVQAIMEAPYGMEANVRSILRSQSSVAKFPHQIYLENPVPAYTKEPEVPEHAHVVEGAVH